MESLKKFYCKSAKIEILMCHGEEIQDGLYLVSEEPRRINAKWNKSTFKYWSNDEANNKFLELVTFWCR